MKSRYLSVRHCNLTCDHGFNGDNLVIHGTYLGRPWYLDEGPFNRPSLSLMRIVLKQAIKAIRRSMKV